jgi:hypothetical protein
MRETEEGGKEEKRREGGREERKAGKGRHKLFTLSLHWLYIRKAG